MAVVENVYAINFLVEDGKKEHAVIEILAGVQTGQTDLTLGDLFALATALEALIDPVVIGDVKKAWLNLELQRFTSNSGDPDSDVEEGAVFSLVAQGTDKRKIIRFPTFDETYIIDGTRTVNDGMTQVQDLEEFFISGITINSKTVRAADSEGRIIEAVYRAEEDFRRRKKPRTR